jgi:ferredoxin
MNMTLTSKVFTCRFAPSSDLHLSFHLGACEGSVACSTCHVILPPQFYDQLPEPEDDENDMLDMAFGLTDTSRLGCQVKLTKALDGITATLPAATRNMYVDGEFCCHAPRPDAIIHTTSQERSRHTDMLEPKFCPDNNYASMALAPL